MNKLHLVRLNQVPVLLPAHVLAYEPVLMVLLSVKLWSRGGGIKALGE